MTIRSHDEFYKQVYGHEEGVPPPLAWIAWKGTDVCASLQCECGEAGHVDGDFFYFYECKCGRKYALPQTLKLIPLTPEQVAWVEGPESVGFARSDLGDG